MRPHFLLDTNILSDLVRRPQGPVAKCIAREGEQSVCTSIIVAAELRFGAQKLGSERLSRQLEAILGAIEILPLEEPADRHYAGVRWILEQRGELIGPNDLLIAAHALALDSTLVTANAREFSRVPGLQVANWLSE
ncbi:MAG: type II toxin-antitoxin system VapC family toxin [Lysobacterales bacterium]|nr:MAG: type II toxin-antitoxin system VapC family toxin [Xanthomonadales bacterium]